MTDKLTVAIIGCGRLGQHYVDVYNTLPDTEVVALVDPNRGRLQAVGERFGVDGLFADVEELYRRMTPDLAAVVLPAKFIQEVVTASAEAGVRGVSTDKPIGARLADVDAMIEACESRGVVFAGGNLVRAMSEVQEAAAWLRAGEFGELRGAAVHSLSTEISGGGCQQIAVMRLFTGAEVAEVTAWGSPREALESGTDKDLAINGLFRLSSGIECPVFSSRDPCRGVDVWTDDALVRWSWALPEIWQGFDASGARIRVERPFKPPSSTRASPTWAPRSAPSSTSSATAASCGSPAATCSSPSRSPSPPGSPPCATPSRSPCPCRIAPSPSTRSPTAGSAATTRAASRASRRRAPCPCSPTPPDGH